MAGGVVEVVLLRQAHEAVDRARRLRSVEREPDVSLRGLDADTRRRVGRGGGDAVVRAQLLALDAVAPSAGYEQDTVSASGVDSPAGMAPAVVA